MTSSPHPGSCLSITRSHLAAAVLIVLLAGPGPGSAQPLPTLSDPATPDPAAPAVAERRSTPTFIDAAARDAGPLTPTRRIGLDRREPGLHPYALYRFQSVDGLPNGPGNRFSTNVHEIAAGISWRIGDHWVVDYSPSWTYYSHDDLEDSVDHSLLVNWGTTYRNWRFNANHRTNTSNTVLFETAAQTERDTFQTTASAAVALNSQFGSETRLGHNVRLAETFSDFREYTIEQRLVVQLAERIDGSLGATYGYADVSNAADHEYITPRIIVDWLVGQKLSLHGALGVEYRQFDDDSETDNPVYDISLNYTPVEATSFSLGYNRSLSPSLFQDAVVRREVIEASLTQRLFGRLFLTLSAGRREADYQSRAVGALQGRRDRNEYYSARLSTVFLERGILAIFYQPEGDNTSNRPNFDYSVRTVGAEVRYNF